MYYSSNVMEMYHILRNGVTILNTHCTIIYGMYVNIETDVALSRNGFTARRFGLTCIILLIHLLPVAFCPMSKSSVPGKQIGTMWGANSRGDSSWTRAKSNSYVKKLYFGWTTLRVTARSTNGNSSWICEKSYSPTRIRICDVNKLKEGYDIKLFVCSN